MFWESKDSLLLLDLQFFYSVCIFPIFFTYCLDSSAFLLARGSFVGNQYTYLPKVFDLSPHIPAM